MSRLLYALDVAILLGWGTDRSAVQRARRFMRRNGLIDRDGKRFVTSKESLLAVVPQDTIPEAMVRRYSEW